MRFDIANLKPETAIADIQAQRQSCLDDALASHNLHALGDALDYLESIRPKGYNEKYYSALCKLDQAYFSMQRPSFLQWAENVMTCSHRPANYKDILRVLDDETACAKHAVYDAKDRGDRIKADLTLWEEWISRVYLEAISQWLDATECRDELMAWCRATVREKTLYKSSFMQDEIEALM